MAYKRKTRDASYEHVVPLTTSKQVDRVEQALLAQGKHNPRQTAVSPVGVRNMMLFEFGIFTGLRVGDIISLKVSDVQKDLLICEHKTGKPNRTHINSTLRKELDKYIKDMNLSPDDWLFPSSEGSNNHVSRAQVWRAIRKAGEACGIPNLGSHTMRKTFGRLWYESGGSIVSLQKLFNHTSQAVTLNYIGIEQRDLNIEQEHFDPHNVKPKRRR